MSPLFYAIRQGEVSFLEAMLEMGHSFTTPKTSLGLPPLNYSAAQNNPQIVKFLSSKINPSDIDQVDADG